MPPHIHWATATVNHLLGLSDNFVSPRTPASPSDIKVQPFNFGLIFFSSFQSQGNSWYLGFPQFVCFHPCKAVIPSLLGHHAISVLSGKSNPFSILLKFGFHYLPNFVCVHPSNAFLIRSDMLQFSSLLNSSVVFLYSECWLDGFLQLLLIKNILLSDLLYSNMLIGFRQV